MKQILAKNKLRAQYRQVRRAYHENVLRDRVTRPDFLASTFSIHVYSLLRLREADAIWGIYKAHRSEVDLHASMQVLQKEWPRLKWAYPRILENQRMEFRVPRAGFLDLHQPDQVHRHWLSNSFSILEPNPESSDAVALEEMAGVFIPAVAFDRTGHRIGSGKGYYDRALLGYRGLRIGVGYSVQISDQAFSPEQHDIQMDYLLTEQGVVKCEGAPPASLGKG